MYIKSGDIESEEIDWKEWTRKYLDSFLTAHPVGSPNADRLTKLEPTTVDFAPEANSPVPWIKNTR